MVSYQSTCLADLVVESWSSPSTFSKRSATLLVFAIALSLAGCGEAWDTYEKPQNGNETEWHECMRKHDPVHRHVCRDLR